MNIKLLSVNQLCYTTGLAGIAVALASESALAFPILAIVSSVTTTPKPIIFTAIPLISTVKTTKSEPSRTLQSRWDNDMLSALFTIVFHGWLSRRSRDNKFSFSSFKIAISRAYRNVFRPKLERLALENNTANLTGVGIVILLFFTSHFVGTFSTTSCLSTPFNAGWIS